MIYEQRVYEALPGKMAALQDRFANHTIRLFEKHCLPRFSTASRVLEVGPNQSPSTYERAAAGCRCRSSIRWSSDRSPEASLRISGRSPQFQSSPESSIS